MLEEECIMIDKYWVFLNQTRFSCEYLEEYYHWSYRRDLVITVLLAVLSSSAVATWVIWKQYPALWAFIIAACQIITIIKPYLPYGNQIKQLPVSAKEMGLLYVDCEKEWLIINETQPSELNIINMLIDMKKRYAEIDSGLFGCKFLPRVKSIENIADERSLKYMEVFFGAIYKEDSMEKKNNKTNPIIKEEKMRPKNESRSIIPTTMHIPGRPKKQEGDDGSKKKDK
jgi:hypothetical protein